MKRASKIEIFAVIVTVIMSLAMICIAVNQYMAVRQYLD
jgi:hypothetical protein